MAVLRDGERVGTVSSGNFSPMLSQGIALAFVHPDVAVGDCIQCEARGSLLEGTVVHTPFVAKH
jgi:aminomethyltransferase